MKRTFLFPLAVVAALATSLTGCQATSSVDRPAAASAVTHLEVAQAEVALDLPLAAQEMAVDRATNTIWFATVQPAGKDTLWAFDMGTGTSQTFDLPDVDYNGYTTHVRVGTDGAVWVSLPYDLARWDPVSRTVSNVHFSEEVDGALPGALDRNSTLPGTWISAILPDGSGVIMARNHVPYLTKVSADLTVSRGSTVPAGYAGASDLVYGNGGTILMLPSLDNPAGSISTLDGQILPGTEGLDPLRFLVDDTVISAQLLDDSAVGVVGPGPNQPGVRGLWTRVNNSGTTVQYDPQAGTITRHSSQGPTDVLRLEQSQGQASGGGIDPATGKKLTTSAPVMTKDRVTAFVVTDSGTVWILRHGGTQLIRWNS